LYSVIESVGSHTTGASPSSGTNCSALHLSTYTTSGRNSSYTRRTASFADFDLQYAIRSGILVGSAAAHCTIPFNSPCRTCTVFLQYFPSQSFCTALGSALETHATVISFRLARRGIKLNDRTFTSHGTNGTMYRISLPHPQRHPLRISNTVKAAAFLNQTLVAILKTTRDHMPAVAFKHPAISLFR